MPKTDLDRLVDAALAIEAEEAKKAGALGFMARALVMATLPHKKPDGLSFERRNGALTLSIVAPAATGLPYGTIPRLLLAWMTTEAVRTKSRDLVLGASLSDFMAQLDLMPTGGRWGTIGRLKQQTKKLFTASITCIHNEPHRTAIQNIAIVEKADLWWKPMKPSQRTLWDSHVTLGSGFYDEIVERPVPIDLRALKALKRSPMALDIYCWLTYRMSYLHKRTEIPWGALQTQFGAGYSTTAHGRRDFKRAFLRQLHKVVGLYPEAKVEDGKIGLLMYPSPSHIKRVN